MSQRCRPLPSRPDAMDLPVRFPPKSNSWRASNSTMMAAHPESDLMEECLKEDLRFYFMNPCEKYRARHQIPWKLGLQILKIVMVTTQLVLFGLNNQLVVSFKEDNTVAFKHLFLKGYSGTDEDDYSCSVYTQQDVYESIFFVINQYHHLKTISLGMVGYEKDEDDAIGLKVCKQHYKKGIVLPSNYTLNIDSEVEIGQSSKSNPFYLHKRAFASTARGHLLTLEKKLHLNDEAVKFLQFEADCIHLDLQVPDSENSGHWMNSSFFSLEFYRLLQVEISFNLKGIDLQTIHSRELPDCYAFHNTITFNNKAHSGRIKIYFDTEANIQECKGLHISGSSQKNTQYILMFDVFVILGCFASLVLCTRSIVLALRLQKRFIRFFLEKYKRRVSDADHWEFINGWYILVIISDLMTIIGSILKMEIKAKNLTNYDLCSILLGTSTLFAWVGVIRYLGYFQTYNVLILTMQASLPKVLRFCACAGMIYLGYTFCGWIVIGPYHEKFEDLSTVAECLFSLVNGDDMFATFAQIQQKSILVWLFSRVYLYSFISLFIYMILSLFIALITDSYDTIKKYQQNGFPQTDLQEFLKECGGSKEYEKQVPTPVTFLCCCQRQESDDNLILIN